jgi:hypothetical protein
MLRATRVTIKTFEVTFTLKSKTPNTQPHTRVYVIASREREKKASLLLPKVLNRKQMEIVED